MGDHARVSDLPAKLVDDPLGFSPRQLLTVPVTPPVSLLNPLTVAAFNEAWYRRAPRARTGELQKISTFFHPLDGVGRWNVLYGPHGFTQYQFVVPFGCRGRRAPRAREAELGAMPRRFSWC